MHCGLRDLAAQATSNVSAIEFVGARAKLARAEELSKDLRSDFRSFLQSNEPRVVQELDGTTGDLVCRCRNVVAPPLSFAVSVGEIVHHLRSCFDHAVWQLVIANAGTPSKRHQFPVYIDAAMYKTEARRQIAGVSARAAETIQKLQPYHAGARYQHHCMWLIHELDRIDKHRVLLVAVAAAFVWGVKYDTEDAESETGGGVRVTHLREGAELVRVNKTSITPGMKVHPQTTFDIALEELGPTSLTSADILLIHLIDFTKKSLTQMESATLSS